MTPQKVNSYCRAVGLSLGAVLISTFVPGNASGATIADVNSTWPAFNPTTLVQSVDAIGFGTHANRGISTTRIDRQTFNVTNSLTVDTIYLSANNYNNLAFNISFFQTTTVNNNPILIGSQVGSTITVDPLGSTASGDRNIRISLSFAEQVTLNATTGTAGYIMAIQLVDTSSATAAFNWVHSNTGADVYTGGRYRRDDGDQTNTRDFGLALGGFTPVPEPTSLGLLTLGGVVLAIRRRKSA